MSGTMLAMIDDRPIVLFNERSWFLTIIFGVMVFLVSPVSPLPRRIQDRVVCWYPPGIFLYWYFFYWKLTSLNPGIHYYINHRTVFTWMMNSGICYAFAIAFSIQMLRIREWPARVMAALWLVVFMYLLIFVQNLHPVVQET